MEEEKSQIRVTFPGVDHVNT